MFRRFARWGWAGAWLWLGACASGGGSSSDLSTEDCSDACAKIGAANCGDVDDGCVAACVRSSSVTGPSACTQAKLDYARCFWTAAAYLCDASGTQPVGCNDQRAAVQDCGSAGAAASEAGASGAGATDTGGAAAGGAP